MSCSCLCWIPWSQMLMNDVVGAAVIYFSLVRDTIWHHRTGSILDAVTAWSTLKYQASHYLIIDILWTRSSIPHLNSFWIVLLLLSISVNTECNASIYKVISPRGQWVSCTWSKLIHRAIMLCKFDTSTKATFVEPCCHHNPNPSLFLRQQCHPSLVHSFVICCQGTEFMNLWRQIDISVLVINLNSDIHQTDANIWCCSTNKSKYEEFLAIFYHLCILTTSARLQSNSLLSD